MSFAGAVRSHTDDAPLELLHGDPANLDSFSVDPLPGDTQNGMVALCGWGGGSTWPWQKGIGHTC